MRHVIIQNKRLHDTEVERVLEHSVLIRFGLALAMRDLILGHVLAAPEKGSCNIEDDAQ
jgi:hypothetical protein